MHEEEEEGEHQDKQTSLYARGTQLKKKQFWLVIHNLKSTRKLNQHLLKV